MEESLAKQAGVQSGDAVGGVATKDGEMSHADVLAAATFLNEREDALFLRIAGPAGLDITGEKVVIDLEDDLEMAWQDALKEGGAPGFQRLGKQRVVGVGEGFLADAPSQAPLELLFIHEDAHELGYGDSRMRVVELDGGLGGELAPGKAVAVFEAPNDVGQRARDKEILLYEAKFFAGLGGVVRIEHLGDGFRDGLLPQGIHIAAFVEDFEVEVLVSLSLPKSKHVHGAAIVADDRNVPRQAEEALCIDPFMMRMAERIEFLNDLAIKMHGLAIGRACDLPGASVAHPCVRVLDLFAVHELLAEETELIMDAVADGGQVQRAEGVHEAGSQAT